MSFSEVTEVTEVKTSLLDILENLPDIVHLIFSKYIFMLRLTSNKVRNIIKIANIELAIKYKYHNVFSNGKELFDNFNNFDIWCNVTSLHLYYCKLEFDDIGLVVAKILCKNTLCKLELEDSNITEAGGLEIAKALGNNNTLKELNIYECHMTVKLINAFANALTNISTLHTLAIFCIAIFCKTKNQIIANTFLDNSTLKKLEISFKNLGDIKVFANALCINSTLDTLNICHNKLRVEEIKALVDGLCNNRTLRKLDLSSNYIRDDGSQAIANILCKNTTLEKLKLSDNDIGDCGVKIIADALCVNTTLKMIDLSSNLLSYHSAKVIDDVLYINTTLTLLQIGDNAISKNEEDIIINASRRNNSLIRVNFNSNYGRDMIEA